MERRLFTSESVTEGHPDKMCDQVSDAILDALMEKDPMSRVACETAMTTGLVLVMGEVTTSAYVDIQKLVRDTIKEIGYTRGKYGFDADTCGVPVGAFVLSKKVAQASLKPGDHGTTYGGNPFVCAAVSKVFDIYEKDMILTHVQELTPYLEKKLDELVEKHECAAASRGMGFMQGIVIAGRPVGEIVKKALEKKLLVISAGSDVLRIVPPLVITKADIDEMAEILDECLA